MMYALKNDSLTVKIHSFGAELISVVSNVTSREYMHQADSVFWKRTSPVLFPICGSLRDGKYMHEGKEYQLSQHGFARDMEFSLVSHTKNEIWMSLEEEPDTLKKYPFHFLLQIGYRLDKNQVIVMWKVKSKETKKAMYFSIGAHPAFRCPIQGEETQEGYGLLFDEKDSLTYSRIDSNGLMLHYKNELELENGIAPIDGQFFEQGVYIVEDYQASSVSILDSAGKAYVKVEFKAPLFGLWAPEKKNPPFLCIEPWYGRCDRSTFEGDLYEREWGNQLNPGEEFERFYTMSFS